MLFSPMKIGKCEIKNRIVMPPMHLGFGQLDGCATEMLMDYYEERAKGGTGLIMTEITRVDDKTGAAAFAQLGVSHDYQIPKLKELADRIHKHGAKIFVQLHHPGRQNVGLMVNTLPVSIACRRVFKGGFDKVLYKFAPTIGQKMIANHITFAAVSPSKCEESRLSFSRVRALRHGEIKKLVREFVDGAVRCQKAGIDGVELHGTHGYLIHQFLSENTNKRTDEYGGSFENRLRFLKEIVEGIREACGKDYPLVVRLSVDECYQFMGQKGKGFELEEGVKYAKAVEAMGVDAIDVSSATYDTINYWLEPTSFDDGWRAYMAEAVKKEVKSIPILAANLIRSGEQAEKQLEAGIQDFVCLGRPHISDAHWANKVKEGRDKEIKRCIGCLHCMESMLHNAFYGKHACCSVNPVLGEERRFNEIVKDGGGRIVVIVGAGPAGLTAAEMLARRGFKPVVLEKENEVGGQLQLANKPPKKEKIGWCAEDIKYSAELFGADIKLGVTATPEIIESYKPYAVIIAAGATAVRPKSIKGADGANVYTTTQILSGETVIEGKKVAVIGSGLTGLETAEMLAEHGNKITVVEMADTIAPGAWFQHLDDIMPKLEAVGTQFMTGTKLCAIDAKGVSLQPVNKEECTHYDFDAVVLSLGSRPVNELAKQLEGKYERLFVIGDSSKVGKIADATGQAYDVAINKIK